MTGPHAESSAPGVASSAVVVERLPEAHDLLHHELHGIGVVERELRRPDRPDRVRLRHQEERELVGGEAGLDARRVQGHAAASGGVLELAAPRGLVARRVDQPPRADRHHVDPGREEAHVVGDRGGVLLRAAGGVHDAVGLQREAARRRRSWRPGRSGRRRRARPRRARPFRRCAPRPRRARGRRGHGWHGSRSSRCPPVDHTTTRNGGVDIAGSLWRRDREDVRQFRACVNRGRSEALRDVGEPGFGPAHLVEQLAGAGEVAGALLEVGQGVPEPEVVLLRRLHARRPACAAGRAPRGAGPGRRAAPA